jgi:NAD(P)-dependent dehydrogenase (short-subunit alcohol dehydrogenase family)
VLEVVSDISDETVVTKIAATAKERWRRVDVLVNNAGVSQIAPAERLTATEYRRVLEIDLVAPFLLARACGAMMLEQRAGSIINVALGRGACGHCGPRGLQRLEAWPHRSDRDACVRMGGRSVGVNAVCPAWVKTEMDVADQAAGGYTEADITGRVPMGRFASPDDVARAIAFLADAQESGYINGRALVVDGGWIADGSWKTLRLRHG